MSMTKVRDALAMLNAETDEQEAAVRAAYEEIEAVEAMAKTLAIRTTKEIHALGMTTAAAVLALLAVDAP